MDQTDVESSTATPYISLNIHTDSSKQRTNEEAIFDEIIKQL